MGINLMQAQIRFSCQQPSLKNSRVSDVSCGMKNVEELRQLTNPKSLATVAFSSSFNFPRFPYMYFIPSPSLHILVSISPSFFKHPHSNIIFSYLSTRLCYSGFFPLSFSSFPSYVSYLSLCSVFLCNSFFCILYHSPNLFMYSLMFPRENM